MSVESRPAHRCEAKVSHKTVVQGKTDGMYDLDGRRHSLQDGESETNTVGETYAQCIRCAISEVIRTEGLGFAPYNEGMRLARELIERSCKKWQERVSSGKDSGKMPKEMLPENVSNY